MKKLFTIVVIISFFAACNSGSEEAATNSKDTVNAENPLTDAVNTADSVTKKIEDSTHMMKDSAMKK